MTFTETETTAANRLAQLDEKIDALKDERRRYLVNWIVQLDRAGHSLRQIGTEVGISHVTVLNILNGYKGGAA